CGLHGLQMTMPVRNAFHVAMVGLAGLVTTVSRADIPTTEATLAIETLRCGDVHLQNMDLQVAASPSINQYVFSAAESRIDIDYSPARYDIVSGPARRVEDRTAAELNARFSLDADLVSFVRAGAYRGLT